MASVAPAVSLVGSIDTKTLAHTHTWATAVVGKPCLCSLFPSSLPLSSPHLPCLHTLTFHLFVRHSFPLLSKVGLYRCSWVVRQSFYGHGLKVPSNWAARASLRSSSLALNLCNGIVRRVRGEEALQQTVCLRLLPHTIVALWRRSRPITSSALHSGKHLSCVGYKLGWAFLHPLPE